MLIESMKSNQIFFLNAAEGDKFFKVIRLRVTFIALGFYKTKHITHQVIQRSMKKLSSLPCSRKCHADAVKHHSQAQVVLTTMM